MKKKHCRINGAITMAKFATLIASEKSIEVGTISILLLVISVWVTSLGMFALFSVFSSVAVSAVSIVVGAVAGFFLVTKLYPGKLLYRFSYEDITSFVSSSQEFTINTTDGKTYSIRISETKQQNLLLGICNIFSEESNYHFEQSGKYFRIKTNKIDKIKTEC